MLATSTATTSVFAHALPYAGGVYVIVLAGFLSVALYQRAATKKTPRHPRVPSDVADVGWRSGVGDKPSGNATARTVRERS